MSALSRWGPLGPFIGGVNHRHYIDIGKYDSMIGWKNGGFIRQQSGVQSTQRCIPSEHQNTRMLPNDRK
jgi:hypothetical protein